MFEQDVFWDVCIGLRYQVSWFSICMHTLLMTWALDSISKESSMPKAECFPLEEGVAWYSTSEVSITKLWRTIVRLVHINKNFGGCHGRSAALVFAARARSWP